MKKRIYIIIICLIIVYTFLLIGSYFIGKSQEQEGDEVVASMQILIDDRVFFPVFSADHEAILYYTSGEKNMFQRYNLKSEVVDSTEIDIGQPEILRWSPNKKSIIFAIRYYNAFYDEDSPLYVAGLEDGEYTFYLLNLDQNQIRHLGLNVWNAEFIDNQQIVFYQNSYADKIDQLSVCDYQLLNCRQKNNLGMDEGINFYRHGESILITQHLPESGNAPLFEFKHSSLEMTPLFNLEVSGVMSLPNGKNYLINQITPLNRVETYIVDGSTGKKQKLSDLIDLENSVSTIDGAYIYAFSLDGKTQELLKLETNSGTISKVVIDTPYTFKQPKNLMVDDQNQNLIFTDLDTLYQLSL